MAKINLLPQQSVHLKKWIGPSIAILLLLVSAYYVSNRSFLPFSSKKNRVHPTITNTKGILSNHSVKALRMTGFLKKAINPDAHLVWGLIKDPETNITVVKVGDHIGQENIPITSITPSGIQLQTSEKTKCFIPAVSTAALL